MKYLFMVIALLSSISSFANSEIADHSSSTVRQERSLKETITQVSEPAATFLGLDRGEGSMWSCTYTVVKELQKQVWLENSSGEMIDGSLMVVESTEAETVIDRFNARLITREPQAINRCKLLQERFSLIAVENQ